MTDISQQMPKYSPEFPVSATDAFGHHLQVYALSQPDKIALIASERTTTWGELVGKANRIANQLRAMGLKPGDTVAALSETNAEFVALFLGTLIAGGCMVPLPGMVTADALARMINESLTRWLFVSRCQDNILHELWYRLDRILPDCCIGLNYTPYTSGISLDTWISDSDDTVRPAAVGPDAPFNLIYSSGTTGTPKGILHDHRFRLRQIYHLTDYGLNGNAINLVSTPLYSNTTLISVLPTLYHGGTLVLMAKFEAREFLALAQQHGVTHAMLVPTQFQRLLEQPDFDTFDLSAFKVKLSAGSPLRADVIRQVVARWPGELKELYGLTEGGVATCLDCTAFPDKWDSVGKPVGITEVRIIGDNGRELLPGQIGEIVGRSGAMMRGYFGREEQTHDILWTSPEGKIFFRTGDVGRLDKDGFLYILDRLKDVIISGGLNVYASDLERVLFEHPLVSDVAVIGIPSEQWGETPLALVVPKPGAGVASETELLTWANARLGRNQRLTAVEYIDDLPRSPMGKLLKKDLRALYQRQPPPI